MDSALQCSHLASGSNPGLVVYYGNLDITALGGAGFASQRSVDPLSWDLANYQGLSIGVQKGDAKKYTVALKDQISPRRPREQSTVSWEYDFEGQASEVVIPWQEFKPTYRGRPTPDAEPMDLRNVKRISIMCRRFARQPLRNDTVYSFAKALIVSSANKRGHSELNFATLLPLPLKASVNLRFRSPEHSHPGLI
ncbi:hypothetical protein DL765_003270 [Monosporascus sp. GIB2]|nr:hypothetical protein DL765_003270 [Monosporascus sp. GIB2]